MTIAKADLLSFVNDSLARTETDIDEAIKLLLRDLSELYLLEEEDATITATSSSYYIAYPSDALDSAQAIVSVTLFDSSSNRCWPLSMIRGGWREYQRQMEGFTDSDRSTPTEYVCKNRRIYLLPAPDESFTGSLWYKKRHPADPNNIEFTDSWENCMKFGSAYFFAKMRKLVDYMNIWGPEYLAERDRQRMAHDDGVSVVE